MNKKIISGVVAYNPDSEKINSLIESLSAQSSHVFVYNNGGFFSLNKESSNVSIIGTGENKGIAHALNKISSAAITSGADYCICFDQDSEIKAKMLAAQSDALYNLQTKISNVIAVGPVFSEKRSQHQIFPIFQIGKFWIKKIKTNQSCKLPIQASFLITSGMMYDLRKWGVVGDFNEDYFIDYVDNEWCLRASLLGFLIYVLPEVDMNHELSDEPAKRKFGRLALKYSPIRRYYQTRNCIFLLKSECTPFAYKLYLILTLMYRIVVNPILDDDWKKTLKMTLSGINDGLLNVTGKVWNG